MKLNWTKLLVSAAFLCLLLCNMVAALETKDEICKIEAVCNTQYYPVLTNLILNAKKSIRIIALSISTKNEKISEVMNLLIKAKERGVDVQVFCEADNSWAARMNKVAMELLTKKGIVCHPDSNNHITHSKLVIIDCDTVLIGSTNLTQNSFDNNNESNLLVHSAEAGKFYCDYFKNLCDNPGKNWALSKTDTLNTTTFFSDSKYLIVAGDMIDRAKKEIKVMMYLMRLNRGGKSGAAKTLLDKLVAASKRGVSVKLYLEQSYKGAFNEHIFRFNKEVKKYLLSKAKIEIKFDSKKKITHSKIILVEDRKSVV